MIYYVDIDGTICTNTEGDYHHAQPYMDRIHTLNQLYDRGHEIHYWTARGSASGKDWTELTHNQLTDWGCRYSTLKLGKPSYDVWIDDKALSADEFFD
jgi:hypothetical protein